MVASKMCNDFSFLFGGLDFRATLDLVSFAMASRFDLVKCRLINGVVHFRYVSIKPTRKLFAI